jgi:uncharacterized membrane protein
VERLLVRLATRDLGSGVQCDDHGTPRVVFPTADWEDYVSVGLDEIRLYGTQSIQVSRRLVRVLETLASVAPEDRRPAMADRLDRLQNAITAAYTDPADRAQAAAPDPHGLGGSSSLAP